MWGACKFTLHYMRKETFMFTASLNRVDQMDWELKLHQAQMSGLAYTVGSTHVKVIQVSPFDCEAVYGRK